MRDQVISASMDDGEKNVCIDYLKASEKLKQVLDKFIFLNEHFPYRANLGTLFKCAMESETMDDKETRMDVTNFIDEMENMCFMIHQLKDLIQGCKLIMVDRSQNLIDTQNQANLLLSYMPIFADKK